MDAVGDVAFVGTAAEGGDVAVRESSAGVHNEMAVSAKNGTANQCAAEIRLFVGDGDRKVTKACRAGDGQPNGFELSGVARLLRS